MEFILRLLTTTNIIVSILMTPWFGVGYFVYPSAYTKCVPAMALAMASPSIWWSVALVCSGIGDLFLSRDETWAEAIGIVSFGLAHAVTFLVLAPIEPETGHLSLLSTFLLFNAFALGIGIWCGWPQGLLVTPYSILLNILIHASWAAAMSSSLVADTVFAVGVTGFAISDVFVILSIKDVFSIPLLSLPLYWGSLCLETCALIVRIGSDN